MRPWRAIIASLLLLSAVAAPAAAEQVTITNQGDYHQVMIDLSGGQSLADVAAEYVQDVLAAKPEFEALADSYLADFLNSELGDVLPADLAYQELIRRSRLFFGQLPEEYRLAIETASAQFSGGGDNVMGDGKISFDEGVVLNLITDVARPTACSAVSVWGSRSATGGTIATRNCEWEPGLDNQLAQLHAVTTIRDGDRSLCMVGWLGFFAAVTAINDNGVFAAILDSGTGEAYSAENKRSYVFDLLLALRDYATIEEVAAFLTDPARSYAFNHNIFLADGSRAVVLENDLARNRALRASDSALRGGVSWDFSESICTVNSFVLPENYDNHSLPYNTARWERYAAMMGEASGPLGPEELKAMAGDGGAGDNSQIYQWTEIHSVIVQPGARTWEIFFRPPSGVMPDAPTYQSVPMVF
jgi:hypothetical protein